MQEKSFHITTGDEYKTAVFAWLPPAEPKAIIHIAHGLAEYGERYSEFAKILNQQGFAVYAHDHIAHGKDAAQQHSLGDAPDNWFNKQVDYLQEIIEHLKSLHPV